MDNQHPQDHNLHSNNANQPSQQQNQDKQDSLSDQNLSSISISFQQNEFNRIYTRQLHKNNQAEIEKAQGINQPQNHNIKQELPRSHKNFHKNHIRHRSRSQSQQRLMEPDRSRSRSREKQNCTWHIYEVCDNMDINNDRFQPLIRNLPIFKKKQQILHHIIHSQFVLVTGQTGCGKSTQVPRLIYEYLRLKNMPQKIICVQPRRLAVKNLHSILSKQIPQHGAVGYHISMQSYVSDDTKIIFMTNGIFLQRLIHSTDFFQEFPFIILDQVHERDIDTDFILLAIKRIIRNHPKVRVILMSATIDNKLFQYYFADDEVDCFMKRQNYYRKYIRLEQEYQKQRQALKFEYSNLMNNEEGQYNIQIQHYGIQDEIAKKVQMQYLNSKNPCPSINVTQKNKYKKQYYYLDTIDKFISGNNYTKKWGAAYFSHKYPSTHKQLYVTACQILQQILHRNKMGCYHKNQISFNNTTVLIFLPGLSEIQYLSSDIGIHFGRKSSQLFQIVKCHSSILNDDTMKKIHMNIKNKCKVIIATNIAESSITVPGVKYIIDFCLSKQINFDPKSRMQNLDLVWASQASCEQRAGRTGRVCDGIVIRLVQKHFYDKLKEYSTPQIQRSSLDRLILRIKLIHQNQNGRIFEDPGQVLGTALQPPSLKNIDEAIKSLIFCGGLKLQNDKVLMTQMGRIYVDIPLDIIYTKLLFYSFLMGTFDDILILVCILSQNKNAFKKQNIEANSMQFFQMISNQSRCDFYALVQAYKLKKKDISNSTNKKEKDTTISLDIYSQTNQLIRDIQRRIKQKQLHQRFPSRLQNLSENDAKERFKITITYGFMSQLMKVRGMIYDDRQQKRAKLMKKEKIQYRNTIILLNSDVIRQSFDRNIQSDNKLKKIWIQNISRNFRINPSDLSITLGKGISFLHCKKQTDVNKILFVKYMHKKKSVNINETKQIYLTFDEMIRHLGDFDYMEQGMVTQYYKQQSVSIDNYSSNRIIASSHPYGDQPTPNYRLLVSNCIMQQSSRLSCRYCSLLPDIPYLDVIIHLLFYPFVALLPDPKITRYQSLYLKKKSKIRIQYDLTNTQIEQANQIRSIISMLMSMELFDQKRQNFIEREDQQILENQRMFIEAKNLINQENIQIEEQRPLEMYNTQNIKNVGTNFMETQQNRENIELCDNQLQSKRIQKIYNQSLKKANRDKKINLINQFWPKVKKFITNSRSPIVSEQKWQQVYFKENNIILNIHNSSFQKSQQRQYMNQIKTFPLKSSYFSSSYISDLPLQIRKQNYENWKIQKLKSVRFIQQKVLSNDPYLLCSQCLPDFQVKIAKLNKVGPIINQYYRQFFQIVEDNVQQLPYNELGDYFCSMLMSIYTQKQYNVYGCRNGHYLMIQFKDERRKKILTFSPVSIIYADGQIQQEPDFQNLQVRYWKEKSERAKQRKLRKQQKNYCFVCNIETKNIKQLQAHIRSNLHESNIKQFTQNIKADQIKDKIMAPFDEDKVIY